MLRILDEVGGELLFGRQVDLTVWDVAAARDTAIDLVYELPDPEEAIRETSRAEGHSKLTTLPLAFHSDHDSEVYSASRGVRDGEQIVALGMNPYGHPPQPRSTASQAERHLERYPAP
jgi:hypothetical protein